MCWSACSTVDPMALTMAALWVGMTDVMLAAQLADSTEQKLAVMTVVTLAAQTVEHLVCSTAGLWVARLAALLVVLWVVQ